MLRIDAGKSSAYCDGMSRRSFVQLGAAGMATAGLPAILKAKEDSARRGKPTKDTAVILIWLDGGPGHMDTYDMKPAAPLEYRGLWQPIPTNVPGMEVTELFPLQAKVADKFSIVRSLYHNTGDHFAGGHIILTSRPGASGADQAGKYPSIGAIAAKTLGARKPGLPAYVAVPYAASIGIRPGYFGANYLGIEHNPFEVDSDPSSPAFKVRNMDLPAQLSIERLENRQTLFNDFDRMRRNVDSSGALSAMNRFQEDAYHLVSSTAAREAFNIGAEDEKLRDRYGRNSWGQSMLLARRLAEAGCTFTTVHLGGWDHHWDLKTGMENYLPRVDMGVASLVQDLSDRGQLDRTLVVLCGEFSRTPRMNNGGNGGPPLSKGTPGRDHWGNAMFCFLAGGGLRGGQIVGSTNRLGEAPKERPVTAADLHATIYHVLGVDPTTSFLNHAGRPVPVLDGGQVIHELL